MSFRKLRGLNMPYRRQMLIRAVCLNHAERPMWEQKKIERLCTECGGAYSAALWDVMTTEKSIQAIAQAHCVSESELYRMRLEFYRRF